MELRDAAVILGVSVDASADQVKSAFRSRARLLHPDRLADASAADRAAAQAAMAQLNEANETFTTHFQRGGPSRPNPEPGPSPTKNEYELLDRFEVMLCPDLGRGVMGTLLVFFDDGEVVPFFGSHDLDVRGDPLVTGRIAVMPGVKVKRGGRIDIVGGGYILVRGGKSRAEEFLDYVTAPRKAPPSKTPPTYTPPPKAQERTTQPPPKRRPSPTSPQDRTPISKVVPELANIAQGSSRFTIAISPGRVDICSCLASCIDRGTHTCALGVSEAADLAEVIAREGAALNPKPLPLPEDLDDLSVRRINPGARPAAVLLDWRSSFPDSGDDESRSAWPCVTLLLHGSADQPSTTLAALVRVLSSAAAIADDWDEGVITRDDAQQLLFDS